MAVGAPPFYPSTGRIGRPHMEVLGAVCSGAGGWTGAGTTQMGPSSARVGVGVRVVGCGVAEW
jgi:hypothetical protein